jgi:hypothetical protein
VLELLGNAKLIARIVRVARGSKRAPRAGRFKVVARFTGKARRKLARRRSVTLVARLIVTDAAGNRTRKSKRIRLRR